MELHDALPPHMIDVMDLKSDHVMADIGSGTGNLSMKLFERAQLKNPVVCVEPSAEMHKKALGREGISPVLKTGQEYFNDASVRCRFDRVLFMQSDHHLPDPLAVFKGVERSLRPNGVCSIWILKGHSCFIRFRDVTDAKLYPNDYKETCRLLEEANLEVKESWVEVTYGLKKSKFYRMLRGHFISNLHGMTDEEIEEGINKLEQGELGSYNDDYVIKNEAKFVVLQAKKPINNNIL